MTGQFRPRDSTPYLSIVAAARNDDHGGNLSKRMQLFVNGILAQCRRHGLDAELIIVDWNPPPDRPTIANAISFPNSDTMCTVRIIEVPPDVHHRFQNSANIPLFQYIAKNVGIRRALGPFVLATNVDLLYSDELVAFLSQRTLEPDCYYRANRHDVPSELPDDVPVSELLPYCRDHILRVFLRDGTYVLASNTFHPIYPPGRGPIGKVAFVFQRMMTELRGSVPRLFQGSNLRRLFQDSNLRRQYAKQFSRALRYVSAPQRARLHTNASGDFTLMARENWWKLHGYPELPIHGMHIDSVLCYMAHFLPLKEVALPDPMRVYHIEHLNSWTPEAASMFAYDGQLARMGVPRMSHEELNQIALRMGRHGEAEIFNDADWGLRSLDLPETVIAGAPKSPGQAP